MVAPGCQFSDAAPGRFGGNACGETLFQLGSQRRIAQALPPTRHRRCELVKEMIDTANPAGEVKGQMRPHQGPTQPRPGADCRIDIGNARHPLGEQMDASRHNAACSRLATCPGTSRWMCIGSLPIAV